MDFDKTPTAPLVDSVNKFDPPSKRYGSMSASSNGAMRVSVDVPLLEDEYGWRDAEGPGQLALYADRLVWTPRDAHTGALQAGEHVQQISLHDVVNASASSSTSAVGSLTIIAWPHPVMKKCFGGRKVGPERVRELHTFERVLSADSAPGPAAAPVSANGAAERAAAIARLWAVLVLRGAQGTLQPPSVPGTVAEEDEEGGSGSSGAWKGVTGPFAYLYSRVAAAPASPCPIAAPKAHRRMLVLVNPVSGKGQGERLWREVCAPVIHDAGCVCDVIVVKDAGEATVRLRGMPWAELSSYDGVIGVGGDGALAEVVQGLMQRPNWYTAVRTVTVGVIPTGSGNGLAVSLLHAAGLSYSVQNAALIIARNVCTRLDVASAFVHSTEAADRGVAPALPTPAPAPTLSRSLSASGRLGGSGSGGAAGGVWGARYFSFLSTSWGIVSDIDIESEGMRYLGDARFDVYGALRAVSLRRYRGRFSYLPADTRARSGRRWSADLDADRHGAIQGGLPLIDTSDAMLEVASAAQSSGASSSSAVSPAAASASASPAVTAATPSAGGSEPLPVLQHLVPFDVPVPLTWRTVEGVFTFLWVTNTTHQSIGVAAAPGSHHNDGVMTVSLVRDCGAMEMVNILLSLNDEGTFRAHPRVETFTCMAFRLEPERLGTVPAAAVVSPSGVLKGPTGSPLMGHGHISLDGEDMPYGPIQAELHTGLLQLYGPGVVPTAEEA